MNDSTAVVIRRTIVTMVSLVAFVPAAKADLLDPTIVVDTPVDFQGRVDDTALTFDVVVEPTGLN